MYSTMYIRIYIDCKAETLKIKTTIKSFKTQKNATVYTTLKYKQLNVKIISKLSNFYLDKDMIEVCLKNANTK